MNSNKLLLRSHPNESSGNAIVSPHLGKQSPVRHICTRRTQTLYEVGHVAADELGDRTRLRRRRLSPALLLRQSDCEDVDFGRLILLEIVIADHHQHPSAIWQLRAQGNSFDLLGETLSR